MADIELTCPKCSERATASEFVDESVLICRRCGEKLTGPKQSDKKIKRHMAKRGFQNDEPEAPSNDGSKAIDLWPGGKYAPKGPKRAKIRHHFYGGALFIVIAAITGYLRFGEILPPEHLATMKWSAVWVALILHALTVLKAFEDSVFQGILCILIPFYSLYYLICVTDAVYFRALVCAPLAGFGWDAAIVMNAQFLSICDAVRAWIAKGG